MNVISVYWSQTANTHSHAEVLKMQIFHHITDKSMGGKNRTAAFPISVIDLT